MAITIGKRYRFAYPEAFKTLPEYDKYRGASVTVIRPLKAPEEYEGGPDVDPGFEYMFKVRADDGWTGVAFESELEPLEG